MDTSVVHTFEVTIKLHGKDAHSIHSSYIMDHVRDTLDSDTIVASRRKVEVAVINIRAKPPSIEERLESLERAIEKLQEVRIDR